LRGGAIRRNHSYRRLLGAEGAALRAGILRLLPARGADGKLSKAGGRQVSLRTRGTDTQGVAGLRRRHEKWNI